MPDTAARPVAARPPHLDPEEVAWLTREAAEHPEEQLGQAFAALAQVHELHLAGGCS